MDKIILYLKKFDWILFAAVILLICFGLLEVYSIALSHGDVSLINFKKQTIFIIIGIILLFLFSFFDYHNWRNYGNYLYILGAILLIGVLIFGQNTRGTKGWFNFGLFNFQPVEIIKFILLIFLARYFSNFSIKNKPLKHLAITGIGTLIYIILILKQPDFGSALILFLLWAAMLVIAGFKKRYLLIVGLILILVFSSGWLVFFKEYQKERILTFLNPSANSLSQGYNITQAKIAVGSGRLMGRGVGFGSQTQLKFLPEAQTDFIFAVIGEEAGFLGVILAIFLFSVIFYRMLISIKKINNDFGIYYILGAGVLIFIEMFINIGMNIGMLPVVGITLPFLSYGGSSIISTLIIIGVAENIIIQSKIKY